MTHIFISYAKKDTRELALSLADNLNEIDSITAWVDRSLRAGTSWELQIQAEIDKCDTMVVLYSEDINRHQLGKKASYVLKEIAYAQHLDKSIIPIMVQEITPPLSLIDVHYLDYTLNGLTLDDLISALCDEIEIDSVKTESLITNPIEHAQNFTGTSNNDWKPYITTFSDLKIPDMPFCLVPVGSFQMGSDKGDDNEKPIHLQRVEKPYWIAQYPVTNAQWKLAVNAGVVSEPAADKSLEWYHLYEMSNTPVAGINWHHARTFVEWMGCRLPTEMEWEYAARGVESWWYPWGNKWKLDNAVVSKNSGDKPWEVTSKTEGKSWIGAYHMSGNVWEWTNSMYKAYPYTLANEDVQDNNSYRVLRGGSWNLIHYVARSAFREFGVALARDIDFGFRLCRSIS